MANRSEKFGKPLSKAVRRIADNENITISWIQDQLGYALGRKGRSGIEYWRRGYIPANPDDVERLARELFRRRAIEWEQLEGRLYSKVSSLR